MGQTISSCATVCGDLDFHTAQGADQPIHEDPADILPPIGELYAPIHDSHHRFIYEGGDGHQHLKRLVGTSPSREHELDSRYGGMCVNHSIKTKMSLHPRCPLPPQESSEVVEGRVTIETEDDSDQESVMSTISPCKDRAGYEKRNTPVLQLRLPIQRSISAPTFTIPSRPSIFRLHHSMETQPVVPFLATGMKTEEDYVRKHAVYDAIVKGNIEELALLVRSIPTANLYNWTWQDSFEDSVLHLAVRTGSLPMVQLLLRSDIGGGPVMPNKVDDTPISLAGKLRHFEILAHLMHALRAPFYQSQGTPLRLSSYTHASSMQTSPSPASSLTSLHCPTVLPKSAASAVSEIVVTTRSISRENVLEIGMINPSEPENTTAETRGTMYNVATQQQSDRVATDAEITCDFQYDGNEYQCDHNVDHRENENVVDDFLETRSMKSETATLSSVLHSTDDIDYIHQSVGDVHHDIEDADQVCYGSRSITPTNMMDEETYDIMEDNALAVVIPESTSSSSMHIVLCHDVGIDVDSADGDDLFCCSPLQSLFCSPSKRSSTNHVGSAVVESSSSDDAAVIKNIYVTTLHEQQEDYDHFLDLDSCNSKGRVSQTQVLEAFPAVLDSISSHVMKSNDAASSFPVLVPVPVPTQELKEHHQQGRGIRRYVPRTIRKAAGRMVRFVLPPTISNSGATERA